MGLSKLLPLFIIALASAIPSNKQNHDRSKHITRDLTADLAKSLLDRHNHYRSLHGVPALTWSDMLAQVAQSWTNEIASRDIMEHSTNGYGENIWAGTGVVTGDRVVGGWYSEIKDYNYSNPGFDEKTGHFTQVVWKATTEVGCGMADSTTRTYVTCNYLPAGNVNNPAFFSENVPKPQCKTSSA